MKTVRRSLVIWVSAILMLGWLANEASPPQAGDPESAASSDRDARPPMPALASWEALFGSAWR